MLEIAFAFVEYGLAVLVCVALVGLVLLSWIVQAWRGTMVAFEATRVARPGDRRRARSVSP